MSCNEQEQELEQEQERGRCSTLELVQELCSTLELVQELCSTLELVQELYRRGNKMVLERQHNEEWCND